MIKASFRIRYYGSLYSEYRWHVKHDKMNETYVGNGNWARNFKDIEKIALELAVFNKWFLYV